jgi:hypothetical protein
MSQAPNPDNHAKPKRFGFSGNARSKLRGSGSHAFQYWVIWDLNIIVFIQFSVYEVIIV